MKVPPRFAGAVLEHLRVAPYAATFPMVLEYAREMKARVEAGRGLLLAGPAGVGKTYALAALTRRYAERAKRPLYVFETTYTLLERYAPVVAPQGAAGIDPDTGRRWTDLYEKAEWLVINDLGKDYRGGKLSEQVTYKIGRLLRTRAENLRVTHITTNIPLTPGDAPTFQDVYGASIWSLLAETTDRYEVFGPDQRR